MKFYLGILVLILLISGCTNSQKLDYSFFIAGHTYGSSKAKGNPKGLYQPFKDKFQFINEQRKMKSGFLLGDVVWRPNAWPEAEADISKLEMPVYIVRGNHDGPLDQFEERFGKSYKKFVQGDDLFIILDPNLDNWNISGDQLVFLMNTLRNDGRKANNIFIFSHQVLWYAKDKFVKPRPNSTQNRSDETNFWTKIEPLLRGQKKPVYLFVGDIGNYSTRDSFYYHSYDNITFVGSGMGGGLKDNFVIIDVLKDGTVKFRLIHLNGNDINGLGKLEDYNIND